MSEKKATNSKLKLNALGNSYNTLYMFIIGTLETNMIKGSLLREVSSFLRFFWGD